MLGQGYRDAKGKVKHRNAGTEEGMLSGRYSTGCWDRRRDAEGKVKHRIAGWDRRGDA
jgi:hypothetical protein